MAQAAALANDLALALDPVLLARRCGLEPDPWQAGVLRSTVSQVLLNCSRQAGKSTVSALVGLHEALYRPPALVLLVSPSLRQSQELFGKVLTAYRALGGGLTQQESALRLELTNGSRILSLPGNETTIRGYSGVRLVVIDEAARVPDDLYFALRPMLAVSGGRLLALTTPFGRRGWFFAEWTEGGPTWQRVEVPAPECPRISPAFLAQERRSMGDWWFSQEFLCQFRETDDQLYSYEQIRGMLDPSVAPLDFGGLRDFADLSDLSDLAAALAPEPAGSAA